MARLDALLIRGANVLTLDPSRPRAEALLAVDGLIAAVGRSADVRAHPAAAAARVVDCGGRTLVPAFIDAHIHLLAAAARLDAVDCGPEAVASIDEIKAGIRERAATTPPGEWVRAGGYDELALVERRHPDRHDLDQAAPDHPVRLVHRTGHACVLNSRALALAGIDNSTPEPPAAYLERDLTSGEPTGLLLEMNDRVNRALPPLSYERLAAACAALDRRLLEAGVTCVQDATATNGPDDWRLFRRLIEERRLSVSLSLMEGLAHLASPAAKGGGRRPRRGGVKLQPRELEHELSPGPAEIVALVRRVDAAGRQVAVHAVGRLAIDAALDAFQALGPARCQTMRHRIEHAGICSPSTAERIARLGVMVVTQPGFLYWNGALIEQRVATADIADLYPLRRLLDAGVVLAGSSDAPVAPAVPLTSLRAAVERRTRSGAVLSPEQRLSGEEALALFTRNAAYALGLEAERGALRRGMAADCVLLSADPTAPAPDWDRLTLDLTVRAGQVDYERAASAP